AGALGVAREDASRAHRGGWTSARQGERAASVLWTVQPVSVGAVHWRPRVAPRRADSRDRRRVAAIVRLAFRAKPFLRPRPEPNRDERHPPKLAITRFAYASICAP